VRLPPRISPLELAVGQRVDIHSLVGAAQYNGSEGQIAQGPSDKGRWEVQIDFQCEERLVALKPENLRPKPSCGWELVATSLSPSTTERDVAEAFAQCGMVRSAQMEETQGIVMVEMAHRQGAEAALDKFQGYMMNSRPLKVEWSSRAREELEAPVRQQEQPSDAAVTGGGEAVASSIAGPQALRPRENEAAVPRRRRSAWDEENAGGIVYTGNPQEPVRDNTLAAAAAATTADSQPPLPPDLELCKLPVKELRRLLAERGANVAACFEKADLLEQAKLMRAAAPSA